MENLGAVNHERKIAFAAACAEWVFPLFVRYASVSGNLELAERLGRILEAVWSAVEGSDCGSDLDDLQALAEALVPNEDEDWIFESGYGQNAAAATAYAIRAWLTDAPQEAAWAARQVYEAADYGWSGAQPQTHPAGQHGVGGHLSSPVVQSALAAISHLLNAAESSDTPWMELRAFCREKGEEWAATLP